MTPEQLNSLALLNIETNVIRSIDMSFLINDFALKKSCKDNIYKESTFYMNENINVNCSLLSLLATLMVVYHNKIPYFLFLKELKNILLIAVLKRSLYFFLKNYIKNGEIELSLSLHGVKPWFYAEQITIRD